MACVLTALLGAPAAAQHGGDRGTGAAPEPPDTPALLPELAARQAAVEAEGWMIRGQSTFVQQFHPAFHAPYRGENSLGGGDQGRNTFSLDILLGQRLWEGAEAIIDPQVSRGYGLSGTRGLAAFPNGEAFRIGTDLPSLYVARLLAGGGTFDYAEAKPEQVAARDRVAAVCARHGVDIRAAALQFCAAHPVVASVIPGAKGAARVRENVGLMRAPIPAALWQALKAERLLPEDAPTA